MREVEANFKEDMIIYQPFTDATAETFDREQSNINNTSNTNNISTIFLDAICQVEYAL